MNILCKIEIRKKSTPARIRGRFNKSWRQASGRQRRQVKALFINKT